MPLIPEDQHMFVVDLHYTVPFADIDPELDAHVDFLEAQFAAGLFVASGPKVPRTGGGDPCHCPQPRGA